MGFRFANLVLLHRTYRASSRSPRIPHLLLPDDRRNDHARTATRCHVGHAHGHVGGGGEGDVSDGVFRLGLAADVALTAGKAVTGYVSGSTALLADAAHSASDIVLSGVAWFSYRAAKAPKDNEHPYGHGKFETLGALGISSMLLLTSGGIAWHAADVLQGILLSAPDMVNQGFEHDHSHIHGSHHHGVDLNHPVLALSMTIVSISVKEGLYWITKRAGEREGSSLMKANAWHHRADAVSSIVALIGVGGAISGVPILDPLAGIVVSGLIMKAGIESGYQSLTELVDAGVPLPVLAPIKQTILQVEGVKGCHRIRGRKAGSSIYLDAHIEVDPFLSVSAAHDIGENVRHQIQKYHNQVAEVFIHIDPSYMQCSSIVDQRENLKDPETQNLNSNSTQQDTEAIVTNTISSLFREKMTVEHITRHLLQGKVLVEVQVSMPPEMPIRDAMDIAKEAENEILKASASINQVSIQLLLGHPIPQLNQAKGNKKSKHRCQN
ncbi:Uncharacterized protein M6B38_248865 [Iris pallida]|uniref:Cation efflux protein cytoplasmic domain-containing protein n=1 Tax=Iris pallida TaxID=29817 RepID=A0AAX6DFJ7_IRIPA|nr:Uncharacterized protein M6B38_248865 [Iris pallida]